MFFAKYFDNVCLGIIYKRDFNLIFLPVNSVVLSMYSLTDPNSNPRDNLYIGIDSTVDDTGSKTGLIVHD